MSEETQQYLPTEGMEETPIDLIKKLGAILKDVNLQIDTVEAELKQLKAKRIQIAEVMLPEQMEEAGIQDMTLSDGSRIVLTNFYNAKITPDQWDDAMAWLDENNHSAIVKAGFSVAFPRGEANAANEAKEALAQLGINVIVEDKIHPSTLRAFVREQCEAGADLPTDMFGVYEGKRVTFK